MVRYVVGEGDGGAASFSLSLIKHLVHKLLFRLVYSFLARW